MRDLRANEQVYGRLRLKRKTETKYNQAIRGGEKHLPLLTHPVIWL